MQEQGKFCGKVCQLPLPCLHLTKTHSACCTHLADPAGVMTLLCSVDGWRWDRLVVGPTEVLYLPHREGFAWLRHHWPAVALLKSHQLGTQLCAVLEVSMAVAIR